MITRLSQLGVSVLTVTAFSAFALTNTYHIISVVLSTAAFVALDATCRH